MTSLRETLYNIKTNSQKMQETVETPIENENRIKDKVNAELDLIGISNHLKGRKYLFDAIFYLINNENKDNSSVFYYVSNK